MRLFIAASFPTDVLADVNERVLRVKSRLPPASWVRPETQHLTFAFLGEQDETKVETICRLAEEQIGRLRGFEATLHGCGFFPNSRHARVAWIGVTPEDRFTAVAKAAKAGVTAAGVALENTDFRPHLTICRIRDHWPPASIELFNRTFGSISSAPFPVDHLTLYSSKLNPSGAVHTPVCDLKLAG